ncbi:hypothetical protein EDD21DRAFT_448426 [Dissophora ornata]|nr:hypothetical protein EDD21DRAFT_448426 [Dissophora ornata]
MILEVQVKLLCCTSSALHPPTFTRMVHHNFQEFLRQHPDLSASSQFYFFDSVPELPEAHACNVWLSSLTALGKDSDPTTQTSSTLLREWYYVNKNNGTTRQYWDKRRLEQETERSEKEAKIQTTITVNRTTARVMQSVNKNANHHLEKFDDSISAVKPVRNEHQTNQEVERNRQAAEAALPQCCQYESALACFVLGGVGPVLNGLFKHDLKIIMHYPNTECVIQKSQGLEANRADIVAQIRDHEVMFGEVTGPAQIGNRAKNHWDLYRLARFGKSFLQAGNKLAPLVQLLHAEGTYYTMSDKVRGVFLLEKVGSFYVPTSIPEVAQFLVTLPALYALKDDLEIIKNEDVNALKRSWGYADVPLMKKRTK